MDSARRVLQVLLLFSESTPTLSVEQMARMAEIAPASVYRYLGLLREMSLVEETNYGYYALSPRALAIGRAAEVASPLEAAVRPILASLSAECGEAALLMRRIGDSAVAAEVIDMPNPVRISFQIGQPMGLHRGAGAKVLLAGMGETWIKGYCNRALAPAGDAERAALLTEAARINRLGWAESAAEVDAGVWAVAAPIRSGDRVLAAISVVGPEYRIDSGSAHRIRAAVVAAAGRINEAIQSGTTLEATAERSNNKGRRAEFAARHPG
ncbi:IclR family transcriptional regulator C-terminal domain-containing protein [Salinibacterium sp. ZJ454]|uniref:IclR family transcriptional regulator n=1 Tax=Salinibacterium sp. ZJ454 TaxID=2708339 RepID=UPI001423897B|nr:IclR family transcriptional regulator C-terminal domain-containing protein [Salinibacterium sp. ZJ454]